MISRLLVANRGEIARRVFRTCRERGITTVAVFSDADARALHTREADIAVRLPGVTAADTYLRADLIVAAALAAGADAVHPGYGFLSENAAFAQAVIDAGLTWVGPSPDAIDAMGSKIASKKLMAAASVPVLPELDPATVTEADLPVLIKASAGGGGRGMRVVHTLADLPDQVEAARAEAAAAFGDPTVFCEPYLATGRHIEVQVMADTHGTIWALGERECSIQRRHQKVVEEAPSPMVDPAMRDRLHAAATAAAAAIAYRGAGTVEFLAADDGSFHFLEMNTRLQVEHPVTELVTGLDLVALQLDIAEGAPLPPTPPATHGHAIEVRLYAEDPAHTWRPQTGPLHTFTLPTTTEFGAPAPTPVGSFGESAGIAGDIHAVSPKLQGHGAVVVRVDSGFAGGDTVTAHYDPMLAKVIVWAPTRVQAARALAAALAQARIHGLVTNRDLLVNVLRHPAFLAGRINTAFFEQHGLDMLARPLADDDAQRLSAYAAALAASAAERANVTVVTGLPGGWRNVSSAPQTRAYQVPAGRIDVGYRRTRDGFLIEGEPELVVGEVTATRVELGRGNVRHAFTVAAYPDVVCVDSVLGPVSLRPVERFPEAEVQVASGSLLAPLPGAVIRVAVAEGDQVSAGQPLLWLEAMKMQHEITAPTDGTVTHLPVAVGHQVEVGAVLAVVTPADPEAQP
ncbi:acetyl/propionyl/methylcrotonyl-CoA carboxylase subunit alpha [Catellatospora citrea]|uniref:Acetyl/propionyl-CoA carboxylase subuit alpha n=1 Tax=Catellatospora citrea TaxID=53366 RepID=A0A8J3P222_9ACTN|nr:biotin carboxylase N-terminal domain-containing protein [Catellatospora citrea]RKE06234.1 propionyl-CoA carboxylase alpha chain [Catellatospora citrea]GIG00573.1 acetyl/propionyl-CoA carboxylase subuit alpha [Catellatospora citrea]